MSRSDRTALAICNVGRRIIFRNAIERSVAFCSEARDGASGIADAKEKGASTSPTALVATGVRSVRIGRSTQALVTLAWVISVFAVNNGVDRAAVLPATCSLDGRIPLAAATMTMAARNVPKVVASSFIVEKLSCDPSCSAQSSSVLIKIAIVYSIFNKILTGMFIFFG
jgi:hypothetical protein